jgi:hypothetical protein
MTTLNPILQEHHQFHEPSSHTEHDIVTISSDDNVLTAAQRERESANILQTVALLADLFSDS